MEIQLTPEVEVSLDQLARDTGRPKTEFVNEFIRDAFDGYLSELISVRQTLDRRYDEIKGGKVRPIHLRTCFANCARKATPFAQR